MYLFSAIHLLPQNLSQFCCFQCYGTVGYPQQILLPVKIINSEISEDFL